MNKKSNTAKNLSCAGQMAVKIYDILNEGLSLMATKPTTDELMATITAYAVDRQVYYNLYYSIYDISANNILYLKGISCWIRESRSR